MMGSPQKQKGNWTGKKGYARPYCSKEATKTDVESIIENSLRFKKNGSKEIPFIEILSMNAGHVLNTRTGEVYIANPNPNTNSIVLRVNHKGRSFLIPGDANEGTWNHIISNYQYDLATDYVLLSHHGSAEEGCNDNYILNALNPKVCFISAGRRNGYNHPRAEVVEYVRDLPSIHECSKPNFISYFRPEVKTIVNRGKTIQKPIVVYKRKKTQKAIFSTQDYGNMCFNLQDNWHVNFSRDRGDDRNLKFEIFGQALEQGNKNDTDQALNNWMREMFKKWTSQCKTYAFSLEYDDGSVEKTLTPCFKQPWITRKFYILIDLVNKKVHKIKLI